MTAPPVAWLLEHSVDAHASLAFVWACRTDITTGRSAGSVQARGPSVTAQKERRPSWSTAAAMVPP